MRNNNRTQHYGWNTIFLVFIFFLWNSKTFANSKRSIDYTQNPITITGNVTSAADGTPLPGASIMVKGTQNGTTTDFDGNYQIKVDSKDAVLVISYVSFKSKEITVGDQTTINVQLEEDTSQLDEVVVIGYGTQKQVTVTGAVEQVDSEVFEDRAVTNVGLALQGQSPGLVVTRNSPRPGNEGLNFRIRGFTSVNGSDPLIVIDGVPVVDTSSFLNLNSDDIESISILKDGASAIYGSRASNGVILVTTKRGKGKLNVNYNFNLRFQTNGITGYSPSMQQYASMWLAANKEETVPNYWVWGEENLIKMQQGVEGRYELFGTDFYVYNANRIDEMFKTRYSYQHNLSLSQGTDKFNYRLSFAYADNQGNLATAYDGQKQYNARFNTDYQLTDKLKLQSNISINNIQNSEPSVGLDNTLYAFDMPFYPAQNPYGQWFATFNGIDGGAIRNAAAMTADGGRKNRTDLTGRIDLLATYELSDQLSFEATASLQQRRVDQELYVLPVPLYNWYGEQTGVGLNTSGTSNRYETYFDKTFYQYYSFTANYHKKINDHTFSVMAGLNAEKNKFQSLSAKRIGYEDFGVYDISLGQSDAQTNGGSKSLNGRYSYLARLEYDYKEKYLLQLLGRRDGNSRFAEGYKFKNFGSAQLGWVISNENFFKDKGVDKIIDFAKIRATYAVLGNEASGLGLFDYLSTVNIGTTVMGYPGTLNTSSYLNNDGLISYTRSWEKVQSKNLGLDLKFLDNRLTGKFDVFEKKNIGMLINVEYPSVLGGSAPKTNSGNFTTKGWEIQIGWRDTLKDFSYNVSVNMSDTHTLINGVYGADSFGAGKNSIVNGFPYNSWFLYKTDGYFANQAEVDAYYAQYGGSDALVNLTQGNQQVELRPGDTRRVDVAGTNNISANGNEESSLIYAGDANPHYVYGINLGGKWKNFDFNMFFQGHLKQYIMRSGYMAYPFSAIYTNQNPNFLGNTWTVDNPNAEYPRLTVNPTRAAWNYANNDFMLQNNRYIRLKTLIVGYTIPEKLTEKFNIDRLRFYFSGNDLWELSSIKDGYDPEMGESSINNGYPFARTWSFGVNLTF